MPVKAEWVAVGVSVLALAVAGGGAYNQQQQLAVAQQQWADARGVIGAEAHLSTYGNEKWTPQSAGSNIPEKDLLAPVQLYAVVDVTNSGATATAIKEVGIWKGPEERLPLTADCPPVEGAESRSIVTCEFPVKIPEFGSTRFYIPLTSRLKTDLECNDFIEHNGINAYIERIDGTTTTAPSKATVGVAAYCQDFNPPEPKP